MAFSHWFEQFRAGDSPYIFDLNYYWNYHSNIIILLPINQPFVAAISLIDVMIPFLFLKFLEPIAVLQLRITTRLWVIL